MEKLSLEMVSSPSSPQLNILFLHGLGGDPILTWTNESGSFWPKWLAERNPTSGIYSLGYPTAKFEAIRGEVDLYEISKACLLLLESYKLFDLPLAIVSHSLGGLLVKQMLQTAQHFERWRELTKSIEKVIFLATPHNGSGIATALKFVFPRLASANVDLLTNNSTRLIELNDSFRYLADKNQISVDSFYEKKPTKGLLVVTRSSADPGIQGCVPIPAIDCNHTNIVKPRNRQSQVFLSLKYSLLLWSKRAQSSSKPDHVDLEKLAVQQEKVFETISRSTHLDEQPLLTEQTISMFLSSSMLDKQQTLDFFAIQAYPRALLIGEPGAGKSTGLQRLTYFGSKLVNQKKLVPLPIYIELRWFEESLADLIQTSIYDLVREEINFDQLMQLPNIVLLLDGFDECDNQKQLLKEINKLSRTSDCHMVVASRLTTNLDALRFPTFELQPLNLGQVRSLVLSYLSDILKVNTIERYLDEMERTGALLELGNPMFLWFYCLHLRKNFADIEPRRISKGQLFKSVIEQYFLTHWESKTSLRDSTDSFLESKVKTLSKIAVEMIENKDSVKCNSTELLQVLTEKINPVVDTLEMAQTIRRQLFGHHLLVAKDAQVSFWHKSIRNYFAGLELQNNTLDLELDKLVEEEKWHEPIEILAGLEDDSTIAQSIAEKDPTLAINCLIECSDPSTAHIWDTLRSGLEYFFNPDQIATNRIKIARGIARILTLHPIVSSEAILKIQLSVRNQNPLIHKVCGILESDLAKKGNTRILTYEIGGEIVSVDAQEILNLRPIIVLTENIGDCYEILGIIHNRFKPLAGAFEDYIAIPKISGYQALHTAIQLDGSSVEICIQVLENFDLVQPERATFLLEYLQSEKKLPFIPISLIGDRNYVWVSTLGKAVWSMPRNSTVLDLAYKIHTEIGQVAVSAQIGDEKVEVDYILRDGDDILIHKATNPTVMPENLSFVATRRARKAIKKYLKSKTRRKPLPSKEQRDQTV